VGSLIASFGALLFRLPNKNQQKFIAKRSSLYIMALTSKLFTEPPNDKLKDCAKDDPAHILEGVNDQGEHVARIQTALLRLRNSEPGLGLPPIGVEDLGNQKYGKSTADCILKYKQARGIVNLRYQKTPDKIVGVMTIDRLDKDMVKLQNRPSVPNLPIPPINPTPVPPTDARRIIRREFQKIEPSSISINPTEEDAKQGVKDIFDILIDKLDGEATLAIHENRSSRQISSFPSDFRVNKLTFSENITLDIVPAGTITTTTTIITYEWGLPLPNVNIVKMREVTTPFKDLKKPPFIENTFIPRAKAEKTAFVVPPNP
jgi:hypothetical protein